MSCANRSGETPRCPGRHGLVRYINAATARERLAELELSLCGQAHCVAESRAPVALRRACAEALFNASAMMREAMEHLELVDAWERVEGIRKRRARAHGH
jgi:hypothetical protein